MATKKVTVLECDICDTTAEPNSKGEYSKGWVSVEIKRLTLKDQDQVKIKLCPKCLSAIVNTINERSQ